MRREYDDKWIFEHELEDYLDKGWKTFTQGIYYSDGYRPQKVYFMLETDPAIHPPTPLGE